MPIDSNPPPETQVTGLTVCRADHKITKVWRSGQLVSKHQLGMFWRFSRKTFSSLEELAVILDAMEPTDLIIAGYPKVKRGKRNADTIRSEPYYWDFKDVTADTPNDARLKLPEEMHGVAMVAQALNIGGNPRCKPCGAARTDVQ